MPPGHDAARLQALGTGWRLDGCAVFVDTAGPCLVTYMVDCDAAWRSTAVRVAGFGPHPGQGIAMLDLRADTGRRWTLNSSDVPAVNGCEDVNLVRAGDDLLPIRRLRLSGRADWRRRAAWLAFPALDSSRWSRSTRTWRRSVSLREAEQLRRRPGTRIRAGS